MRRSVFLPLLGLALCAAPVLAQGPGAGPGPGPMPGGGPSAAGMLLAATGQLHLTDAQVTRLAAIARRAEERHAALRTSMATAHADPAAAQASPEARMSRMRQAMEGMREQGHADLRDALAVLTPDQVAKAFEMASMHRRGPVGHGPGNGAAQHRRRMGPGGPGAPGMRRGPDGPPPPRDGAAPRPPQQPDGAGTDR